MGSEGESGKETGRTRTGRPAHHCPQRCLRCIQGGPVAILSKFDDFDSALREVNDSVSGLQAGIFTRDIYKAHAAWDRLEVGGVVIGDVPSWRVDPMPYGGVKESGLGREGVRFVIEDMTEVRLMVIRTPGA